MRLAPAGPVATAAEICTPDAATALPLLSRTCTTGCAENGAPAAVVPGVAQDSPSFAGEPAFTAIGTLEPPTPLSAAVSVTIAGAVLGAVYVVVARPLASVCSVVGLKPPEPAGETDQVTVCALERTTLSYRSTSCAVTLSDWLAVALVALGGRRTATAHRPPRHRRSESVRRRFPRHWHRWRSCEPRCRRSTPAPRPTRSHR
jgi:hypothetical protein